VSIFSHLKNPFRGITTAEHMARRLKDAQASAEHHRRESVDAQDAANWSLVQVEYHRRMVLHYEQIATQQSVLQSIASHFHRGPVAAEKTVEAS
jgi:hypothetical protein